MICLGLCYYADDSIEADWKLGERKRVWHATKVPRPESDPGSCSLTACAVTIWLSALQEFIFLWIDLYCCISLTDSCCHFMLLFIMNVARWLCRKRMSPFTTLQTKLWLLNIVAQHGFSLSETNGQEKQQSGEDISPQVAWSIRARVACNHISATYFPLQHMHSIYNCPYVTCLHKHKAIEPSNKHEEKLREAIS